MIRIRARIEGITPMLQNPIGQKDIDLIYDRLSRNKIPKKSLKDLAAEKVIRDERGQDHHGEVLFFD